MRAAVVGAGIFGLCSALALARAGVEVDLWEASWGDDNASSVAAGMLAPVGEALFDASAAMHYDLLSAARDCWPAFAKSVPALALDRSGTIMVSLASDHERFDPAVRSALTPYRDETIRCAWFAAEEVRVADVQAALKVLGLAFRAAGGRIVARRFTPADADAYDRVVLATGPSGPELASLAPELGHLTPIKGQLAVLRDGPLQGPTLRWPGGYLTPSSKGAIVGATMEEGKSDRLVDQTTVEALRDAAATYLPSLATLPVTGRAGVRMQTPDALPLVGPSQTRGVFIASGARRNGWLLGPLVGQIIASYLTDQEPGVWAAQLDPRRFDA